MADDGPNSPANTIGSGENFESGTYIWAVRFTSSITMTMTSASVRVKTYGGTPHNVQLALYADSSNNTGALLTNSTADLSINAANTWFTSPVTNITVTSGVTYWIAIFLQTTGEGFATTSPGNATGQTRLLDSLTYPNWPNPLNGTSSQDQILSMYISGTVGPTNAQLIGVFDQEISGCVIGRVDA